ncbi:hypothetical protein FSW04_04925 [Baekduia soli]|uniref:IPT/TIG domain-containing protein n=1 Tax=Baekduia soli TaxID=496014 RepID=A0A5B8U1W9_9ACTN|nr:hypothetical protein [Baekduia soli]QEC46996.1 hypothetical protein FSW04_04925 [Baekduia soli]
MRRLAVALPIVLTSLTAASAQAAIITTDRACYLQTPSTVVTVRGSGFGPLRPYTVLLAAKPLPAAGAMTDDMGRMQGTVQPPLLARSEQEHTSTISVTSDDQTASAAFTVTRFLVNFSPSRNVAPSSRVRFSVYGFGIGTQSGGIPPDVYLHYVSPAGRLRHTVRLGRSRGQCGSIVRTARRRLFPFPAPAHGKWRLQFDTSRAYRRGVKGSKFLFFTVGVDVRTVPASRRTSLNGSAGSPGPRGGGAYAR